MSYQVLGVVIAERFDTGDIEFLDCNGLSPQFFMMGWAHEAIQNLEYDFIRDDIPQEPGIYALSYVLNFSSYQTYDGEYDEDVDVLWQKIRKFNDDETKAFIESLNPPVESEEEKVYLVNSGFNKLFEERKDGSSEDRIVGEEESPKKSKNA